jgi:hypothetical protein
MSGSVGRTLAGKALDSHIAIYKNRTLRHRIFRTIAQIDRAFLWSKNDQWDRGVIYATAASVIKRKFPEKRLALLRKHLYAYAESLFKKVYVPETLTQIALAEKATTGQIDGKLKRDRDQALFDIGSAVLFFLLSYLLLLIALR